MKYEFAQGRPGSSLLCALQAQHCAWCGAGPAEGLVNDKVEPLSFLIYHMERIAPVLPPRLWVESQVATKEQASTIAAASSTGTQMRLHICLLNGKLFISTAVTMTAWGTDHETDPAWTLFSFAPPYKGGAIVVLFTDWETKAHIGKATCQGPEQGEGGKAKTEGAPRLLRPKWHGWWSVT